MATTTHLILSILLESVIVSKQSRMSSKERCVLLGRGGGSGVLRGTGSRALNVFKVDLGTEIPNERAQRSGKLRLWRWWDKNLSGW